MCCLLTVLPETYLSQQRSTHIQISDVFSRGHDPIAHARRAIPAHVGYIFIECVIVIVIVIVMGRCLWVYFFLREMTCLSVLPWLTVAAASH